MKISDFNNLIRIFENFPIFGEMHTRIVFMETNVQNVRQIEHSLRYRLKMIEKYRMNNLSKDYSDLQLIKKRQISH